MIVWGVQLRDEVTPAANAAALAMGTAAQRAQALTGAMKSAQSAVTRAAAMGDAAKVRAAAANWQVLREELQKVQPAALEAAAAQKALESSQASAAAQVEMLGTAMSALAVAAVAAGAAVAGALYEGAKIALEASENVKRLTATFDALGDGAQGAGRATLDMIRGLEKELPQSEATIAKWARQLEGAGMNNLGQLRGALKATAAAEALVEGGGERVNDLLARMQEQALAGGGKVKFSLASLAGTGIGEREFLASLGMTPANFAAAKKAGTLTGAQISSAISKALEAKAAGPLAAQMDELSTMETKASDAAKHLFEDVDTSPFTAGVRSFFSVFDQSNPSGQVLKATLTAAFNAVFKVAGKVFEFLRVSFLHLMIWGLQTAIFLKPIVRGFIEWASHSAALQTALDGLKYIALGVGAALAVVVGAIVAMGAATTAVVVGIDAAVAYVIGVIPNAIASVIGWAAQAYDAAVRFVDGLVNGIRDGIGRAVNAVKELGSSVVNGLKGLLGIHSPSAVMFELGGHTSAGFAEGISGGQPQVRDASASLGQAATGGAGGAQGSGGGAPVFNFDVELHFDASHAQSASQLQAVVEEALASLGERLALMVGSAPEPA